MTHLFAASWCTASGSASLDRFASLHGAALRTAAANLLATLFAAADFLTSLRAARRRGAGLHFLASLRRFASLGGFASLDRFAALHGAAALRTAATNLAATLLAATLFDARRRGASLHFFASLRRFASLGGFASLDRFAALNNCTALGAAATNLAAALFVAALFDARSRLASLRGASGWRTSLRSCTTCRLTTTLQQTSLGVGDGDYGHQSGHNRRRQQDTTVHGSYSFVKKNRVGYSRILA
jgi:hypothetical protein